LTGPSGSAAGAGGGGARPSRAQKSRGSREGGRVRFPITGRSRGGGGVRSARIAVPRALGAALERAGVVGGVRGERAWRMLVGPNPGGAGGTGAGRRRRRWCRRGRRSGGSTSGRSPRW
jgi:hypothetical protein